MVDNATDDVRLAFPVDGSAGDPQAKLTCMRDLHQHYMQFFVSPVQSLNADDWIATERIVTIEKEWNRYEEARVNDTNPQLPATAEEFKDWFEAVAEIHEYHDICDYLRNDASLLDIALMVHAESKVESYFDDLMALAQSGSPMVTKMTIASNYWDEMGNGKHDAAHTVMLDNTAEWMREHALGREFDFGVLEIADGAGPVRGNRGRAQATGRAGRRLPLRGHPRRRRPRPQPGMGRRGIHADHQGKSRHHS